MAIPVQCPECHKRYQAPDSMAGRRVKCKYCGIVFLIAADTRTENPDFDLAQLDELSATYGGTASGGTTAAAKTGAGRTAAAPVAGAGPASLPAEPNLDDVFQVDFVQPGAPRTNKLYVFPMSRLLDRWLPPVLLAIGLLWAVREGWSRNPTGQPWVGALRAGVFVLAFFASVYPFTLMGVRAAARRLNFELPPRVNLRVLGTFAVPAALAAALWLIYQDVTGLLLGAAIGVAVSLPVLFLLLRLLPREAPITFAYAAASFGLSIVVTAAALFAFNLMLVGILRSARTEYTLTISPFGPGFRWDPPYMAKRVAQAGDGGVDTTQPDAPDTNPTTGPADNATGTTRPAIGKGDAPPPDGSDAAAALADTRHQGPTRPTLPPETTTPGGTNGRNQQSASGESSNPFIPDGGAGVAARKDGIVKDVRTVLRGEDVTAIVRPAVPGPWVLAVRPGVRGTDRVERWNTDTWKQAGEAQLPRDPDGNIYTLSPDGDLVAFITDFPSLSVQVYSFRDQRIVREIRLKLNPRDDWGDPQLLGFSRPDQVVVHWRRGNLSGIELQSARTATPARHFSVLDFDSSPGTWAVSPDGQNMSVLWREPGEGGIATYALATGKLARSFAINVLDWHLHVRPAGLAYTPDGSQVAAVIEGDGQGLFALWPALGKPMRPNSKHVVPLGTGAAGAANGYSGDFAGPAFDWLDGGRAYLLYGSSVFETETGRFLGDVGLEGVRAQLSGGGDVVSLVRPIEAGGFEVDAVTLDLAKARGASAASASGTRPPGKPATRRVPPAGGASAPAR